MELMVELGSVIIKTGLLLLSSVSATVIEYDNSSTFPLCNGDVHVMFKYGLKKFVIFVRALIFRLPGGFDKSKKETII